MDQIRETWWNFCYFLSIKSLKSYLYLRRFEFHIVSVVIEYPLSWSNIIHRPFGSSDSLRQKEWLSQSRFCMYWFTDLLDTLVVMWFLFKLVSQLLSWASKVATVTVSACFSVHEGGTSQKIFGLCLFTVSPQEALSCFGQDFKAQWILWNLESAWLVSAVSRSGSILGASELVFSQHGFQVVLKALEKRQSLKSVLECLSEALWAGIEQGSLVLDW